MKNVNIAYTLVSSLQSPEYSISYMFILLWTLLHSRILALQSDSKIKMHTTLVAIVTYY